MGIFEELKNLPDASPVFRAWLWKMERENLLEKLLERISLAGFNNHRESLQFLLRLSQGIREKEEMAVACCDMDGESQIFRKMRTLLRDSNGNNGKNSFMFLGTIGHGIMPLIVSGELFRWKKKKANVHQLEIFNRIENPQAMLFNEKEFASPPFEILDVEAPISMKFSRVSKLWDKISKNTEKVGGQWPDWIFASSKELEELFLLFSPLFWKYANFFRRLWYKGGDIFVVAVTLMSLASAMIYFRKEKNKKAFFPEVPILDFTKHGLSGGRADGVRISPVFGGFSKRESKVVEDLKKYHKIYGFKSFGHLFSAFDRLGSPLEFDIIDWKFIVGDVLTRNDSRVADLSAFNLPLAGNVEQMKRYVSLSSLSLHFHDSKKYALDWAEGVEKSTLYYLSPFSPPKIFDVIMSAEEKKSSFFQRIVEDWDALQKTAELRNFNNAFCRQLLPLLEDSVSHKNGNGDDNAVANAKGKNGSANLSLFEEAESGRPIRKIVKAFKDTVYKQSFVDELELIRKVKQKDGTETLLMDFGALLDAIAANKVFTRGISARGGFIACIMPDHQEERTPSFHVSPSKRMFKCFGCGASGKLVNIPTEIASQIPATAFTNIKGSPLRAEIKKLVIPEKHHLVMLTAQQILQSKFWGSEAEEYLKMERMIDLDLAFSLGAGYGDDSLINELMDWGLSLDELQFYGFVGFSQSLNQFRGIGPLLAKRGFKPEQMRRDVKIIKSVGGERKVISVAGSPFSSLSRRVSFPLTLAGKNTSFYGRAASACDKRYFHRKLKVENVPQGGFNMEALGGESDEVFVVESVVDSLSLMMLLKTQSVISVIGVDNYIVLDLVAESGKKIAVALNNDPSDSSSKIGSGQKATQKIIERFKKQNLAVRDLTSEMLVPAGLNDYNDLLRRMVREKQKQNF